MNRQKQCAYWTLTINEGAKCFNNISNIIIDLVNENPNLEYSYILHNPDDIDNNMHYHLVIYFKGNVKRFTTILNLFEGAHIEATNQQRYKRCIQYLIHKNNPEKVQYSQKSIISNIDVATLADILNSEGYDFELFLENKINDYLNEFYTAYNDVNTMMFINRFGLSAISKYYFVLNDLCNKYLKTITMVKMHTQKLSPVDKAFEKYINKGCDLKLEWQLACYHYGFKGDLTDYKNNLYRDFIDSVNRGDLDIKTILEED